MRITYIFLEIQRKQQTKWMNRTYDIKASSEFLLYWVCFSFVFTMKKKKKSKSYAFRRSLLFTFVISDFCSSTVFFPPELVCFFSSFVVGFCSHTHWMIFCADFQSLIIGFVSYFATQHTKSTHLREKKRWTILFWFNFSSWPVHAHSLMYVTTSECVRILPILFSVHRTATHQSEMKWKRHWDDSWIFADLGIVFALNFALCT